MRLAHNRNYSDSRGGSFIAKNVALADNLDIREIKDVRHSLIGLAISFGSIYFL